jgi:hypothetical protein
MTCSLSPGNTTSSSETGNTTSSSETGDTTSSSETGNTTSSSETGNTSLSYSVYEIDPTKIAANLTYQLAAALFQHLELAFYANQLTTKDAPGLAEKTREILLIQPEDDTPAPFFMQIDHLLAMNRSLRESTSHSSKENSEAFAEVAIDALRELSKHFADKENASQAPPKLTYLFLALTAMQQKNHSQYWISDRAHCHFHTLEAKNPEEFVLLRSRVAKFLRQTRSKSLQLLEVRSLSKQEQTKMDQKNADKKAMSRFINETLPRALFQALFDEFEITVTLENLKKLVNAMPDSALPCDLRTHSLSAIDLIAQNELRLENPLPITEENFMCWFMSALYYDILKNGQRDEFTDKLDEAFHPVFIRLFGRTNYKNKLYSQYILPLANRSTPQAAVFDLEDALAEIKGSLRRQQQDPAAPTDIEASVSRAIESLRHTDEIITEDNLPTGFSSALAKENPEINAHIALEADDYTFYLVWGDKDASLSAQSTPSRLWSFKSPKGLDELLDKRKANAPADATVFKRIMPHCS